MSESYSTAEVAKHKSDADGFWLIVENNVYDVTSESLTPNFTPTPWKRLVVNHYICFNGID
jgi:hypothetical protein